ncbi:MAG: hypothetical protein LBH36_01775 [Candidatus Nomurabacteria bacterium]|jgi:hypothetical protein|nr:hypothetical protein [Candidatus Nomurabacteria bacterium]
MTGDKILGQYAHFNALLPTVAEQVATLKAYVAKHYKGEGSDLLDKLDRVVDDGAPQTITNCKVVVVWLGSLRTTVHFYQDMVGQRQTAAGARENSYVSHYGPLRCGPLRMELDETAYQGYGDEPGVFIVSRLNLLDNWDPESGSSVVQARANARAKRAAGEEYYLASIEALALYAVADPNFYRSQDGRNLPYYDLAGIRSGDDLDEAPYSRWNAVYRQVSFISYEADGVGSYYAGPSFRGVTPVV